MRKTIHPACSLLLAGWLGAAGLVPATAGAQDLQSHASILEAARQFLEERTGDRAGRTDIRLGSLDRRLRLAQCDAPLEGFLPPGGRLKGNTSVGVRCNGSRPWKLYVPARVRVLRKVAVAKGYLGRGAQLTRDQVHLAERDVTTLSRGFITDPAQVVGKTLKRAVSDGRLITPGALTRPTLVRRGEQVIIMGRSTAFEVRMKGEALADGSKGDLIRVKNKKSERIVEGRVTAQGLVTVQL